MPMFDFMQLGSNLLHSAAAARRAFAPGEGGRSPVLGGHCVKVAVHPHTAATRAVALPMAARKPLWTRCVQALKNYVNTRSVTGQNLKDFKAGLDKSRTRPEPMKPIERGLDVAKTFADDLNRAAYYRADSNGRKVGQQLNVINADASRSRAADTATSILETLGNNKALFERVTQFAQQGGLAGLHAMQMDASSPVKLNGQGVYVADASGLGDIADCAKTTYAVGLRRPGVAVISVAYSNQNITSVLVHGAKATEAGKTVFIDPLKSRLDLQFTVEVEANGAHRLIGGVRLTSILVPARAVPSEEPRQLT